MSTGDLAIEKNEMSKLQDYKEKMKRNVVNLTSFNIFLFSKHWSRLSMPEKRTDFRRLESPHTIEEKYLTIKKRTGKITKGRRSFEINCLYF